MEVESVSCECCGLEEECTGDYIVGVRAYFGGRWLCGLCSEAVKYEAGKQQQCAAGGGGGVEDAVRAHMAICRTLKSGGPAGRVAAGMRQLLRTASLRRTSSSSSSSSSSSTSTAQSSPRGREHHRASSSALSVGI